MWDNGLLYSLLGLVLIIALLTFKYWGNVFYFVTKNWRVVTFTVILSLLGAVLVVKQQEWKYEIAYRYFTGTKHTGSLESKYHIRMCKQFIKAKLNGEPAKDDHYITVAFFRLKSVSNWEFCARTFGLNYWKHDTSINGQDGGRVLCDAYARSSYRSGDVDAWCDTVFAPVEEDHKV